MGRPAVPQALSESRQRMLDTALRLFGERGYGGRTLLDAYLSALADCGVMAALLIGDPTVLAHPVAARCRSQRLRLRDSGPGGVAIGGRGPGHMLPRGGAERGVRLRAR